MDTTTKIVLILAVVAIVALFRFDKDLVLIIKALGNIFKLKVSKHRGTENRARSGKTTSGGRSAAIAPHPLQPFRLSPWLSRRRLKISLSLVLAGSLIAMPVWWWNCHSEFWKLELANHITDTWTWWTQSPNAITHEVPGRRTLQSLTGLLDDYANVLANDPHRVIELWVVDHYWQYWTTDTFKDYMRANRRFIDSGGKIHRMFILTPDDLRNPQVTAVLRNQCEEIGADVWRGDAAFIANKAEYQVTARAFQQMPYTETGFQTFDVLQLEDLTYYSSDFSPDYRVVGVSNWGYGQKLDLKPLFNKSIAQRIDCSMWRAPQLAGITQRQ